MALSETARLVASLELKDLFSKQLNSAEKSLNTFDKTLGNTQSRAYKAGSQIGTGIRRTAALTVAGIGFLAANVAIGINSLEKLEAVTAQTNAALKSTHDASGQTAQGIRDMSNAFENLNATMDDTAIQGGANILLTFTNIRKDAFKPALQAALDLSQAMGQDLKSSVVQIGKALNDPLKGLTALTRVGVTFSAQQKKQIADAVKVGNTFAAQKIILAELNKEFGGSFLAGGNTTAGKVAKFKDAVDDLQRVLATALLPVVGKVSDALTKFLADPKVISSINDLGKGIASLFSDENLKTGADLLTGLFQTAKAAAPVITATARATLGLVQAAVSLFQQLPAPLQELAVGAFAVNKLTGGLVTNVAGGIVGAILGQLKSAVVNVEGAVVNVAGAGGLGTAEGIAAGAAGVPIVAIAAAFTAIVGAPFYLSWLANTLHIGQTFNPAATNTNGLLPPGVHTGSRTPNFGTGPGNGTTPSNARDLSDDRHGEGATSAAARALSAGGPITTAVKGLSSTLFRLVQGNALLAAILRSSFRELEHATSAAQIKEALHNLLPQITGHGGASTGAHLISDLKSTLLKTTDPTLRAEIKRGLAALEKKQPGREWIQKQLNQADKILRAGNLTKDRLATLTGIQRTLRDRGDTHAAALIGAKITAAKNADVAAAHATADAIRKKNFGVYVTVPVTNTTYINSREVRANQVRYGTVFRSGGSLAGSGASSGQ